MPILLYHRVGRISECEDNLSPERFEEHIKTLRENNIEIVRLSDYLENHSDRKRIIAITFDDGMRSVYQHVYPLSLRYGFNFTVFLNSYFIGISNWHSKTSRTFYSQKELAPPEEREALWFFEYLTRDEILTMKMDGILFGSHGKAHRLLTILNRRDLREEVFQCRQDLEAILKENIIYFSYPWGTLDRLVKREVKRSGYRFAFTSNFPRRHDPFSIGRIVVGRDWDGEKLLRKIGTAPQKGDRLPYSLRRKLWSHFT